MSDLISDHLVEYKNVPNDLMSSYQILDNSHYFKWLLSFRLSLKDLNLR